MRKMIFPALLLLIAVGCASTPDNPETSLLSSSTENGTTTDFDVSIDQTNQPVLIGSQETLDFKYAVEFRNQTSSPVTLKRINVTSMGAAPVRIANTTRAFDKTIAPGATETVDFWATALIEDFTQGNRLPVTVRLRTTVRDANGKDRTETFTRRVAAEYVVGLAR